MEIKTKRLMIKQAAVSDADGIAGFVTDREYIKMMVFFPKDSYEETVGFLDAAVRESQKERPEYYEFVVMFGDEYAGIVSMYFDGNYDRGELGWLIRKEYRGRGFALEAAEGLIELFRREMGLKRFIAECDSENEASRRVIKKLGMSFVEVHGGRKNRNCDDERFEELYEIIFG